MPRVGLRDGLCARWNARAGEDLRGLRGLRVDVEAHRLREAALERDERRTRRSRRRHGDVEAPVELAGVGVVEVKAEVIVGHVGGPHARRSGRPRVAPAVSRVARSRRELSALHAPCDPRSGLGRVVTRGACAGTQRAGAQRATPRGRRASRGARGARADPRRSRDSHDGLQPAPRHAALRSDGANTGRRALSARGVRTPLRACTPQAAGQVLLTARSVGCPIHPRAGGADPSSACSSSNLPTTSR